MALADLRQDIIRGGQPHHPCKKSSQVTRLRPGFFVLVSMAKPVIWGVADYAFASRGGVWFTSAPKLIK